MPALGHRGYLSVAKESTWGTAVIASMESVEFLSESFKETINKKVIKSVNAARTASRIVPLSKTVAGQLSFEPEPEYVLGYLLKSLLPTENLTDDGAGNGGKHAFTPGASLLAGITVQVGRDIDVATYAGGQVKSMSFQAQLDDVLKATADMSFKDVTRAGTPQTPTLSTQNPFVYHTGTMQIDASAVAVRSFSLNINGGLLEGRGKLGSNLTNAQAQQPGVYEVTGEIETYWDDMTQLNKFLNHTIAALSFEFTGTAVGTTTRSLKFVVPRVAFTGDAPTIGGAGEILLKLPFTAIKDGSGSPNELVQVTLANSKRTAY